jgi:hypothetical protein
MEESYTLDAFVQLLYRELPAEEAVAYFQWIQQDAQRTEQYRELMAAKSQLPPKSLYNPSISAVQRILAYSAATAA